MTGQKHRPDGAELGQEPVAGIDRRDGATVVRLQGELDLYNAQRVRDALFDCCSETPQRLVIDLADVRFIDSTALGVLIEASTRLDGAGLVIAAPGFETRRALEISGLARHFTVADSLADALA
jgi:anti-sigma B factor antagonist